MSIFDREPGTGTTSALAEVLGEEVVNLTMQSIPPALLSGFNQGVAVVQQAAAIGTALASAASMGPLAIATAVYQGLNAANSALEAWADAINIKWTNQISSGVDQICRDLCVSAKGGILTRYQPSNSITLAIPKGYEDVSLLTPKKDRWDCNRLRSQYKPGYVNCLGRPTKSAILYTPIPILVAGGGAFDVQFPASIYGESGPGVYPSKQTNPAGWANFNWWGLRLQYLDVLKKWEWVARIIAQDDASPAPPVRTWTTVAIGLAPTWGPQGQNLPTSPYALGYVSGLLARPAPDLDKVAKILSLVEPTPRTAQAMRTTELLLWAREDLRRRKLAPGAPEGNAWRNRLYPPQKSEGGSQGLFGEGMKGSGGSSGSSEKKKSGGSSAGLAVAGLGLGYLFLKGKK